MCGMRRTPCCGWGTQRCVFLPCPVHTHRDLAPFVTLSQGESKGEETIFWAQGKMCGAKRSEWRAKSSQRHCSKEGMGLEEVYL